MVAFTYPLLGIFWSLLMFAGLALIVFIPLFGALMYLIAKPT